MHYFNEAESKMPVKHRLRRNLTGRYKSNLCIHGHFNRNRGFGVDDYYPKIKHYITFIRDPLEIQLSLFHFNYNHFIKGKLYRNGANITFTDDIDQFLETSKPYVKFFMPGEINLNNIEDYLSKNFVHLGDIQNYQRSLEIIAEKLNKPKCRAPIENITKRHITPSETSIKIFKSKCDLEYKIYNYAVKLNM